MKTVSDEDLRALSDPHADVARRVQAVSRLAFWDRGKYDRLEPDIAALLDDEEAFLRAEAIKALLFAWRREKYLDRALSMLTSDPHQRPRKDAAFALGEFLRATGRHRPLILRRLIQALKSEQDEFVRLAIYRQLLETLAPERPIPESEDFNPETDIDWALLNPFDTDGDA